jgi:hypothetical protein
MAKSKTVTGRSGKRFLKLSLTEKEAYVIDCILANIPHKDIPSRQFNAIRDELDNFFGGDMDDTEERLAVQERLADEYPEINVSWEMEIGVDGVGEPALKFAKVDEEYNEDDQPEDSDLDDDTHYIEVPGYGFIAVMGIPSA